MERDTNFESIRTEIIKISLLYSELNGFLFTSSKLLNDLLKSGKVSKRMYREIYFKYITINDINVKMASLIDRLIMQDSDDNYEIIFAEFLNSISDIKSNLSKIHSIYVEVDFDGILPKLRDEYNNLIKGINSILPNTEEKIPLVYSYENENDAIKSTI